VSGDDARGAIWTASAAVTDSDAVEAILASLPPDIAADARELIQPEHRAMAGMRYGAELRHAWFLHHTPAGRLLCITFAHVENEQQADALWVRISEMPAPITEVALRAAYTAVTGVQIDPA
jgi:uncharacterized protein YecE (DUF72 family)